MPRRIFQCECEHKKHFDPNVGTHPYMAILSTVLPIKSIYGTYHVCEDCAKNCIADFLTPEEKEQTK